MGAVEKASRSELNLLILTFKFASEIVKEGHVPDVSTPRRAICFSSLHIYFRLNFIGVNVSGPRSSQYDCSIYSHQFCRNFEPILLVKGDFKTDLIFVKKYRIWPRKRQRINAIKWNEEFAIQGQEFESI